MRRSLRASVGRATFLSLLLGGLTFALAGSASTLWVQEAKVVAKTALGAPDWDRASSAPVTLDMYEIAPKARYKLAPSEPVEVVVTAGAAGSGEVTVSWAQKWLGRGQFQDFVVSEKSSGKSMVVESGAQSVTFEGFGSGVYSFQVTAQGQYEDATSSVSAPVVLLAQPAGLPACGYLVDVNLSTQFLIASYCGKVYLTTLITSGMPGQRSPIGVYTILYKERNVTFYSPWAYGSAYWYAPMHIAYAAAFLRGWKENPGDWFLHTNPNEPDSAFGPGSQDGPYASRGCIHVPYSVMANLYDWMPIGTGVYVHS